MKRYLSLILALVIVVSLIPATSFAAGGDIVFDFDAFATEQGWGTTTATGRHTEYSAVPMTDLSISASGTAATTGLLWETKTNPRTLRIDGSNVDWTSKDRSGTGVGDNNKVAFDFTVETAGWYKPTLGFYQADSSSATISVYHIAGGKSTYLGDAKPSTVTASALNAVYLPAGANTVVFAFVTSGKSVDAFYISKLSFAKLASAPTGSVTVANFPTDMIGVGATVSDLTASVAMSYGTNYRFSGNGIDASTYYATEGDSSTYIKIEAEDDSIVEIASSASTTARVRDNVTYSIKGLKEGETDITFTPVIGGVKMTDMATKKSVTVGTNELTGIEVSIDDNEIFVGKTANLSAVKTWSHAANEAVSANEVTYTASPDDIVTIENGVVTGVKAGTATITATLKEDPTKSDTVSITVAETPTQRTYEYVTSFDGFNTDKMLVTTDYKDKPVIRESGGKPYAIQLKAVFSDWDYEIPAEYSSTDPQAKFKAMNFSATDKWELVGSRDYISGISLKPDALWHNANRTDMNDTRYTPYIVLRVNVEAAGDYYLQLKGAAEGDAHTAVYFFKDGTSYRVAYSD